MRPCAEFDFGYLDSIDTSFATKAKYLNIEAGFDIETTSTIVNGEESAFMYIWMFGIGYGNDIFYGRTWEEFITLLQVLIRYFELGSKHILPIYIHNLAYEFQFMRKYFDWEDVFSIKERKPIRALTVDGIEFRCSLILSGMSLADTARNLVKYKVSKLEGDLDYDLPRHQLTTLTDKEMGYCENDIAVITAYIKEQIEHAGNIKNIPMTRTGRVREHLKKACYTHTDKETGAKKRGSIKYQQLMSDMQLDGITYRRLKRAFMGGFTHSNPAKTSIVIEEVSSFDLTSSYPAVMLAEKFPMRTARKLDFDTVEEFEELREKYCILMDVKFTGLRNKIGYESYISEYKANSLKGSVNVNGRVFSADELSMTITDIDFDIIEACYEWDSIGVSDVIGFKKAYLPRAFVESVLEFYEGKTTLKGVEGQEVNYALKKEMANSCYGMTVTDIVKDNHTYIDEWGFEQVDPSEALEKYNGKRNRTTFYAWGIWVTAYARRNLWSAILNLGNDYIYSDTDSVKFTNADTHKEYFDYYNNWIVDKIENALAHNTIDPSRATPKNIYGDDKPLGVWDYEGTYTRFKTLGAKRYMVEKDGKLEITIAGLPKKNGVKYLEMVSGGDNLAAFELFDDDLYVPAEYAGKLTHRYVDDEMEFDFIDYNGVKAHIFTASGVHLSQQPYNMSVSAVFLKFIGSIEGDYDYEYETDLLHAR